MIFALVYDQKSCTIFFFNKPLDPLCASQGVNLKKILSVKIPQTKKNQCLLYWSRL